MAEDIQLPNKPSEPLETDCCGTGCKLCVFDIHKQQILRWEKLCDEIRKGNNWEQNSIECEENVEKAYFLSPYEYKSFKLVEIVNDTTNSKIYRFDRCLNDKNDETKPKKLFAINIGQHVAIKIGALSRQYTVLRVNEKVFDILIKIYSNGKLTPLINRLSTGDNVEIRGPFGDEISCGQNKFTNIVMLAAGTGIAPMVKIIESILDNEEDETRIKLLFSCKRVEEVLLRGSLKHWSSFWNFQVEYFLSNKTSAPYGWKVHYERIRFETLEDIVKSKLYQNKKNLFLICGTKSFEKDMLNYLQRLEISDDCIRVF